MKTKKSHTCNILKKLLEGETLISSNVFVSNTNQYFGQIKDQGIVLIEWNEPSEGRHLKRKLIIQLKISKKPKNTLQDYWEKQALKLTKMTIKVKKNTPYNTV